MKIGIFSDVHGCLHELEKTLALFESLKVDQVLCVGDLIDKGPDSDGVVELMRSQSIPCVQGNHDAKSAWAWLSHHQQLKDTTLEYLAGLPPALTFHWLETRVYITHSNPWQDSSVYVYPSRPKALFEAIAKAVDAKVIILGHTHIPMHIQVMGQIIINPGAVYGNSSSDSVYDKPKITRHTCGVLSLPELSFDVYDVESGEKLL